MATTTLLNMTKDSAVVADNVREFSREALEKELAELSPALEQNKKQLEEIEKLRADLLALIPAQEERLNLLTALHNEFEERFPSITAVEEVGTAFEDATEGRAEEEDK